MAVGLKGVQQQRTIADAFSQKSGGESLIKMSDLDLLIGSGGVLSHAPRRVQSMSMLIDAFQPEGITELAVDSIFMMPHLGVLSTINADAAVEVFDKDCLVRLGTCVAPTGETRKGESVLKVELADGNSFEMGFGQIKLIDLGVGEKIEAKLIPAKKVDLGDGPGKEMIVNLTGGQVGVIFDTRGRPLKISTNEEERIKSLKTWHESLKLYPE